MQLFHAGSQGELVARTRWVERPRPTRTGRAGRPSVQFIPRKATVRPATWIGVEVPTCACAAMVRRIAQRETLSLAQRFQAGMLPQLAEHDLMRVRSLYRPGLHQMLLGGDFLDVTEGPDGTVSFVLGYVAGHGPEQAALGATLRGAWLSVASIPDLGPADWARALNHVVRERAPDDVAFVTALMGQLDPRARTLDYVSAGHPPPILLLPAPAAAPLGDAVLGVESDPEFTLHRVDLPPAWAVLMVTDGLFEGRLPGQHQRHGDYDAFMAHLQGATSNDLDDPSWLTDLADVLETAHGGPLSDDAAAMLLTPRRPA